MKNPIHLLLLLATVCSVAFADPIKAKLDLKPDAAPQILTALSALDRGLDVRVPQGSEGDKVIHRAFEFTSATLLALATDFAAVKKINDDREALRARLMLHYPPRVSLKDEHGNPATSVVDASGKPLVVLTPAEQSAVDEVNKAWADPDNNKTVTVEITVLQWAELNLEHPGNRDVSTVQLGVLIQYGFLKPPELPAP